MLALARGGITTGASGRHWASYASDVSFGHDVECSAKILLTDPQISGRLIVACAPEAVDQVMTVFRAEGFEYSTRIRAFVPSPASVTVI